MPGTWRRLESQPSFNGGTMLLLTDGRVLCGGGDVPASASGTSGWHALTPDISGDYVNGEWSPLQGSPGPSGSAAAVLRDGRVFIAGHEAGSLIAGLYDPVAENWQPMDLPTRAGGGFDGWTTMDGAPSCVLPDGRLLLGDPSSTRTAIFDPSGGTWTPAGTGGAKRTACAGEGWTLLTDGTVLTVECSDGGGSQLYVPGSDAWIDAGSTRSMLPQTGPGDMARTGPAVLLPDERVFAVGASGNTALYTPPVDPSRTAAWSAGPMLSAGGQSDDILIAADLDGDGQVEVLIANQAEGWTQVRKWDGAAFVPVWMSPSPLDGPAGKWSRGRDSFVAADVDGDGHVEIVIAGNADGRTGLLKWDGASLAVVWMGPSPLNGPAKAWSLVEDRHIAADVDGDGRVEIVVASNANGRTGVLKWDGTALVLAWSSRIVVTGSAGDWRRGEDSLIAADVDGDGRDEIVIASSSDGRTGLLKWDGASFGLVWTSPSLLVGPAGNWRRGRDSFIAADVDGDGRDEIVIASSSDGWTGLLRWDGASLAPVWASPSPLDGPAGSWNRGEDSFIAADVDGDGRVEILIAGQSGPTGVLKWIGSALALVWTGSDRLEGSAGGRQRGLLDTFIAADIDRDGLVEAVVLDNDDGWVGIFKWIDAGLAPVWESTSLNLLFPTQAPASLLPNGNVLFSANPGPSSGDAGPAQFMEFQPSTNSFAAVAASGSGGGCHQGRFLLLPTGQVLLGGSGDPSGQGDIRVYSPDGRPHEAWRPTINPNSVPQAVAIGASVVIEGTRFNGLSQAVSSGGGTQMATNYPLVRVRHRLTGQVAYCRTSNHATMGVATGAAMVSTNVFFPEGLLPGPSELVVVANGTASDPVLIDIRNVGLLPVWTSSSQANDPAGNWRRAGDSLIAADVDGDGQVEILVAGKADGWTGLLKWHGTALALVWAGSRVPDGPGGSGRRGLDSLVAADIDGDGKVEIVAGRADGRIGVLGWDGAALVPRWAGPLDGPAGLWRRGRDSLIAADVDGDGQVEIVIASQADGWTGLLKWNGTALDLVWASRSPLDGPAGNWRRGRDSFIAADVDGDGRDEIVIASRTDGATGLLKWDGAALAIVWASRSLLRGPAGDWRRGKDSLIAADIDGDGQVEIVIASEADGWTGLLKWDGAALVPLWASPSPLVGPAGGWRRGKDSFIAADVDGDGRVEIVIANRSDGWTGVLKWDGAALAPIWASSSPLNGPLGNWQRGLLDVFIAADVDHDGLAEAVVASNDDGWAGALKWTR